MDKENSKLIIIGAGAAGIMAAVSAKKHFPHIDITIIEKNSIIGKKITVCGSGRCNITNANVNHSRYYGAGKSYISKVLSQFDQKDIREFLESIGISLYEEVKNGKRKGKIFPTTNSAKTITAILENYLDEIGVKVELNTEVLGLKQAGEGFEVICKHTSNPSPKNHTPSKNSDSSGKQTSEESFVLKSDFLVLASGGKTWPRLGATGFSYDIAKELGHSVVKPVPSALPIVVNHPLIRKLTGIRCNSRVTSFISGENTKTDTDEMLFTNYGLSGPVILNISRELSVAINREENKDCKIVVNLLPDSNENSLYEKLVSKTTTPKLRVALMGMLHHKVVEAILGYLKIPLDAETKNVSKQKLKQLVSQITNWELDVEATKGWDIAEFTAGGVSTKEITTNMQSKIIPNLYLVGEVVNVDGDVGGFNLSWAWSSGWVAGKLG